MLEPCGEEKQLDLCEMHSTEIIILGLKGDLILTSLINIHEDNFTKAVTKLCQGGHGNI